MRTITERLQGIERQSLEAAAYSGEIDPVTKAISIGRRDFNRLGLIVFAVPGWQQGTTELPDTAQSVTDMAQLPAGMQTFSRVWRGVGLRAYATPQGVAGASEAYEAAGVYVLTVDDRRLADHTGQSRAQIYRQYAALRTRASFSGLGKAVERVHQELGDVDLAVYDQPPAGQKEQRRRGIRPDEQDKLLIVRSPLVIKKIGELPLARTASH